MSMTKENEAYREGNMQFKSDLLNDITPRTQQEAETNGISRDTLTTDLGNFTGKKISRTL